MMSFHAGTGAVDHAPCRYGRSRALFRGPPRDLSGRYVAVLGGSASFGRQIARPYATLLDGSLGRPVVNLAAQNAGPDFYLADPAVLAIAARADLAVVELAGAEAVSNPFYAVHARRNDRVLGVTPALRSLFPEVDFAEIHFARHLLSVLRHSGADRFAIVARCLRATWRSRMQELLVHLPPRRVLLDLGQDGAGVWPAPPDPGVGRLPPLAGGPATVLVTLSHAAIGPGRPDSRLPDSRLPDTGLPDTGLPDADGHRRIAEALLPRLRALLPAAPPPLVLGPAWALA
jgi:hypothetical protein